MAMRLEIFAAAAILLPVAALAQSAKGDQQSAQQPAAGATAQPADSNAVPAAGVQADTKAQAGIGGGAAKAATKDDVKAGASVYDSKGNAIGKIDSIEGKNAVLNTGKVQVRVPLSSFAHNDKGLLFGMSKADIEAAANKNSNN